MVKYCINISGNIKAVFFKHDTRNVFYNFTLFSSVGPSNVILNKLIEVSFFYKCSCDVFVNLDQL